MKGQVIGYTIGILLSILGIFECLPALLDFHDGSPNALAFFECAIVSMFFGGALILTNYTYKKDISIRQTFMLTSLSWFFMSLFASFPLYFSDLHISFTDAFFEAISGITTTGSTILSGLDTMSRGILLWRSITQWIGGIGIIAFAIVILPFLRVGGMQLFQTESSDRSEKIMPRTFDIVKSLLQVYVFLTLACFLTYNILGMNIFDALNHALTTIPTGGYSTHDASFGYFESPALHYAGAFFMLAGGIPFILYVKFFFQGKFEFFKDEQFKSVLAMFAALIFILTAWAYNSTDYSIFESLRYATFNIISVVTTTGFATTDYTVWGSFAASFFFFITFLGACAGSTAGGIKVMRLIIAFRLLRLQLKKLIYPRGVFTVHYQGRSLDPSIAMNVLGFLAVFVTTNAVLTVLLTLLGLDFETAISGAATSIANVGPGIGERIGPAGNFSDLPDAAKWLLSGGMLLGRLEILTILVLFKPDYWRA